MYSDLRLGENPSSPTAQSDPSVINPETLTLEILSRLVRTANLANEIFIEDLSILDAPSALSL